MSTKATIVLVDDFEALRAVWARNLRELGHPVIEAANGAEALTSVSRRKADSYILISDYSMPRMDGAQLLRELSENGPRPVKAIIWTSLLPNDAKVVRIRERDFGFPVEIISKPMPFTAAIA